MDLGMPPQNWLLAFFGEWGQIIVVFVQFFYWIALSFAAVVAAAAFKRLVDFKTGAAEAKAEAKAAETAPAVSVDAFVE